MFRRLKDKLTVELHNKLPGEEAHNIMMPIVRSDKRIKPINQSSPTKSAVLILFYQDDQEYIKFPLIQRPIYNGAHSAQVSLPGGKVEKIDNNIEHTALREAEEEIGIDPQSVEVIGKLSDIFIWVSNYIVTPIIAFTNKKPIFVKDDKEVDEIIETDLNDIMDLNKRKEGTILVRGKYKIQTPYFDIADRMVWGATAMMLSELSVVIEKTKIFN